MFVMVPVEVQGRMNGSGTRVIDRLVTRALTAWLRAGAPRVRVPATRRGTVRIQYFLPVRLLASVHRAAAAHRLTEDRVVALALAYTAAKPRRGRPLRA